MARKRSAKLEITQVLIEVPVDHEVDSSIRLHLDVNLSGEQAQQLRKAASALEQSEATLNNGRAVRGYNGAIRWILERIRLAADEATA